MPGTISVSQRFIGATVASVSNVVKEIAVFCQALDANDNSIGTSFTLEAFVTLDDRNLVEVDTIECRVYFFVSRLCGMGLGGAGQFVYLEWYSGLAFQ